MIAVIAIPSYALKCVYICYSYVFKANCHQSYRLSFVGVKRKKDVFWMVVFFALYYDITYGKGQCTSLSHIIFELIWQWCYSNAQSVFECNPVDLKKIKICGEILTEIMFYPFYVHERLRWNPIRDFWLIYVEASFYRSNFYILESWRENR